MKNIRNLISGQTRMQAIQEGGIEYGTEVWHKRCTGYTTACAMRMLAHAMDKQGKAVDASCYAEAAETVSEVYAVYMTARALVDKLGFIGFTFHDSECSCVCNVFETLVEAPRAGSVG